MLEAEGHLSGRHRMNIRVDTVNLTLSIDRNRSVVDVDDQWPESARVGQRKRRQIGRVQLVNSLVPVVATERGTRQLVLERVIELTIAGCELPLAVATNIPGATNTRSDLVAPTEADGVRNLRTVYLRGERRQEFVLEAYARVNGHTRMHLPLILDVEALIPAAN